VEMRAGGTNLIGRLLSALDGASPVAATEVLRGFLADAFGSRSSRLFLVDYDLLMLGELAEGGLPSDNCVPVEGSDAGDAFRHQEIVRVSSRAGTRVFVPVSVRAEQLGVLEVDLPARSVETALLEELVQVGVCLAYALKAGLPCSDVLERARRRQQMALAAEMQWALLPIRSYECPEFALAGQLIPAYEVGGDMFDYTVEAESLLIAVTDAMGHGLRASLLTTLAVNTLRNARRSGVAVEGQAVRADGTLHTQFGGDQFVTALMLRIELASGGVTVVNAGSPPPCLLNGQRMRPVRFDADFPLGMFGSTSYRGQPFSLQPGDRLVLVSDGVLEAVPRDGGEPYGERRLEGALLATRDVRPQEAVRRIANGVRSYRGTDLRDDATIVCLDWRGEA